MKKNQLKISKACFTCLIIWEVFKDSESRLDGAVVDELLLDLLDVPLDAVAGGAVAQVGLVGDQVVLHIVQ